MRTRTLLARVALRPLTRSVVTDPTNMGSRQEVGCQRLRARPLMEAGLAFHESQGFRQARWALPVVDLRWSCLKSLHGPVRLVRPLGAIARLRALVALH